MESAPSGGGPRRRRWHVWLAVAAAAALLGWAGLAVLLRTALDPSTVAAWMEPRLSAALNRRVELGDVRITLFPRLGLELGGLRIHNPDGFGELPLASVGRVRLHPRLLPLLRRQVRIDRIRIDEPRLLLLVREDGVSNFGDFVPEGEEGEAAARGPGVSFDVRRIELRGGRIGYRDAQLGRAFRVARLDADGSVARSRDGWSVTATLSADSAEARHPAFGRRESAFTGLGLRAEALAGPHFEWVDVRQGTARLGRIEARLEGRVDSLKTPVRRLDLRLASDSLPLGDVLASLPERTRERLGWEGDGALALRIAVRGEMGVDRRPDLSGDIALRGARLARRGGLELARGLEARASLAGDSLGISRLRGEVLGGPLALDGTVWLDSLRRFAVRVAARPDLGRLSEARPREDMSLSGAVDIELGLAGRFSDIAATRARGRVELRGIRATLPALLVPIGLPSGRLDVAGEEARWSDLVVELGEDRLTTSGTARDLFAAWSDPPGVPTLTGSLAGRRLLADEVFPAPPDSIGYGKLVFARLGGRRLDGRTAEEIARERDLSRPTSLPARGELALAFDTLRWLPYRLSDFRGVVRFSPERAELSDATFRMFGGNGSGRLVMQLGEKRVEPFRVALRVDGARADEILSASSPLSGVLSGTLSLDLATRGNLDSLFLPPRRSVQGEGVLTVADGAFTPGPIATALASFLGLPDLERLEFSRWEAPFTIREGSVQLTGGRIAGRAAVWEFTGSVGFGGGLDLGVAARLSPERARAVTPSGGGAGAELLRGLLAADRPLDIGLRIGGDVSSPRLSIDPSAIASGVTETVRGEVKRRVEEEIERRLGGAEGDTAARGAVEERLRREGERRLEEQAEDALRGLFGRDTARARHRDTARAAPDTSGGR